MRKLRFLLLGLMVLLFLTGIGVCLYPILHGGLVDSRIEKTAEQFLSQVEIPSYTPDPVQSQDVTIPEPTAPSTHTELWEDMMAYNKALDSDHQTGLNGPAAYEQSEFRLSEYGLESEIFGVISIPAIELEMPIYIGASSRHMADGAAILGQTSIPIGGVNTNSIIAGHRGWGGASYFRYIDKLAIGDIITITNLWEILNYSVSDIQIIQPNDVEAIHIQEGRELVTLLSCHPFASGGKQRFLVICERIYEPAP